MAEAVIPQDVSAGIPGHAWLPPDADGQLLCLHQNSCDFVSARTCNYRNTKKTTKKNPTGWSSVLSVSLEILLGLSSRNCLVKLFMTDM